jgi:hypothetical protein
VARTAKKSGNVLLKEFPVVFVSYDEPWADAGWQSLLELRPDAKRVHGVKGLNACHQAAAEEAGTERFLTVDADTVLTEAAAKVTVPEALLQPDFRLDWQSRNTVNGIVSGNGSLKLWSRELAMAMRSHEAAPDDRVSLDADIGSIKPGRTRLVLMPGCYSESDPAGTPFHGFRAGFRETAFLSWLLRRSGSGSSGAAGLSQLLGIWCSLGRHARNGLWVLYGARMGLMAEHFWSGWDIREIHDYGWFLTFWNDRVFPRIGAGGERCVLSDMSWNTDRLEAEVQSLGGDLAERTSIAISDLGPNESQLMAEANLFPAMRTLESLDSLGRAFQKGRGVAKDPEHARQLFETAALLGYPSAVNNLARLHELDLIPDADAGTAKALFLRAIEMGSPHAPYHLASMLRAEAEKDSEVERIEALLDLSAERGFAPVPEEDA